MLYYSTVYVVKWTTLAMWKIMVAECSYIKKINKNNSNKLVYYSNAAYCKKKKTERGAVIFYFSSVLPP